MSGIALIVPFFNDWLVEKEWPKWKNNLISGIVISIVCSITTLPVVLYYFKQFSNWFIVGNLLLIPVFTVLIYLYLFLMVLSGIGLMELFKGLKNVILLLFDGILDVTKKLLVFIDELPFGYSYGPNFSVMQAVMLSMLLVIWIHRLHFPDERKWSYWAFVPFLFLVSL
jgi:hypothetical protein